MKKIKLLILLTGLFSAYAFSQEKDEWTLEKCISYALENNIQIKRQELQSDLSQADYKQSYFNFTPSLSAGLEHSISSGRALNTELYRWENARQTFGSMGIRSEITLFNGLQNFNTVAQMKYSFLSSKEDLEKVKNDITLQIINYYLQVLFDEELMDVAKSQYELTLLQVEKTKSLVDVGNVAKGQLYEIQAQAASEKLNYTAFSNKLKMSVLDLVQLLDLDSIGNFTVVKPLGLSVENTVLPSSFNEAMDYALANMPEIKGAGYKVKSSEKNLAVKKGQRSPELYLSGLYYSNYRDERLFVASDSSYVDYPFRDQLKNKQYSQVSIGLSIPVFNRYQTQTSISKAKIALEDSKLMLDQQEKLLYKNIQQAHTDAVGAFEKYQSALEAVKSNEEALNYTRQKFEVGLVNVVDYSIAKNNYSKAMSDMAQAKYEYIFKAKILDFYSGKEITL
ncbi:MAG: TolC family protein [Bacteroidales bacterium]|nr:TolC family protein [Bacteroidales bacterium]MCB9000153.1 TolC family protein [Bacteroidales bacterium]MCB9013510.1 TolC family protein [Bacteroidales bacterium]